jgi:hypothetical protein
LTKPLPIQTKEEEEKKKKRKRKRKKKKKKKKKKFFTIVYSLPLTPSVAKLKRLHCTGHASLR